MKTSLILILLVVYVASAARVLRVAEPIKDIYIVKLKKNVQLDDVLGRVRITGGRIRQQFRSVYQGFSVELTERQLELVSKIPGIEYIEEDGVVRAFDVGSWGLDRIDTHPNAEVTLDQQYNPTRTGSGIDVFVIDTGVNDQHVDFEGRATQAFVASSLNDNGGNADCNGHGTHCSGTVGSKTYGVAKGVEIFGVKVLSCIGFGSNEGVIEGVNWVYNETTKYKARPAVASMSLGGGKSEALDDAVNALVDAGIPVAVAAGNENQDACNVSPARAVKVTTVGSTTRTDIRSSFSNWGQCVDIFAPGSGITSTWISPRDTRTISGTSMAAPHVAGALALYNCKEYDLIHKATPGVIQNVGDRSPNLLLYVD